MTETTLSASLEDYLEAIFHIVREKQAARPKDISKRLEVGNSSVTGALKALAARKLVNYAPYDLVTLTPSGEEAARDVVRRHETLREFFIKVLATDEELAGKAACGMEHSVPADLIDRLVKFVEFVDFCPKGGTALIDGFRTHLESGCRPEDCEECSVEHRSPPSAGKPSIDPSVTTLADLVPGQSGIITKVRGEGTLRRRLMDLGLLTGTPLTLERSAPLGDPLEILVKGTHLSLRREEAAAVHIQIDD